jgi:hypothetical protein
MIVRRAALAASGLALLVLLPGCETTAAKSARLAAKARPAKDEQGLRVATVDTSVRVQGRAVVGDANGTAVVVALRNTGRAAIADVPVAIDVRDATGTSLFRNDQPGADAGLVSASLLAPGRTFDWVDDQVQLTGGKAASVDVRVGRPRRATPAQLPRLVLGRLKLADDAGSIEGRGRVANRSAVAQRGATIYAVARRGAKVVAAGRAVVGSIPAGHSASFAIYFIGDPRHAKISVSSAPSVGG